MLRLEIGCKLFWCDKVSFHLTSNNKSFILNYLKKFSSSEKLIHFVKFDQNLCRFLITMQNSFVALNQ